MLPMRDNQGTTGNIFPQSVMQLPLVLEAQGKYHVPLQGLEKILQGDMRNSNNVTEHIHFLITIKSQLLFQGSQKWYHNFGVVPDQKKTSEW